MKLISKTITAAFSALALTVIAHAQPTVQSTPSLTPPSMKLDSFVRGVCWPFKCTKSAAAAAIKF